MSDRDPIYVAFHAWRRRLDAELSEIHPGYLRALASELRRTAAQIDAELERREQPADRHDARLYRQRRKP
jgi:hypothetical protein